MSCHFNLTNLGKQWDFDALAHTEKSQQTGTSIIIFLFKLTPLNNKYLSFFHLQLTPSNIGPSNIVQGLICWVFSLRSLSEKEQYNECHFKIESGLYKLIYFYLLLFIFYFFLFLFFSFPCLNFLCNTPRRSFYLILFLTFPALNPPIKRSLKNLYGNEKRCFSRFA